MQGTASGDDTITNVLDGIISLGFSVLIAIVILIIGFKVASLVEKKLVAWLLKSDRIDETISEFLASLAKYVIILITVIAVLERFGVETTSLIALLGAAGLAVGFALQGTLSNIAAGVMLLVFRPFKIGQVVEVGGHKGSVASISLFVTELDTPDNVRIIIPNSAVWGASVVNYNYHDIRRLDQVYGIGYGADIDKAIKIINQILDADSRALKDPSSLVAVTSLGDSSVDLVVRVWCNSANYWNLNFDLLKSIKERFDQEGIDIPYPCRTVYQVAGE